MGQILLDAAGCRQAVVAARVPVDHRKRIGAFGQYHFELGAIATSGGVKKVVFHLITNCR